jgi:HAD superfamily hydrolase (TIGR01549 family)
MTDWPTPAPFRGVIFDIHSTLIDQGSAQEWLDAALAVIPHPLSADERAILIAFLDRIWEGARISDPGSSRDLSFADHSRVFHELIAAGPGVDRELANALYDVMLDTWHAYDDTVPTLQALKAAGIRICLLSNAGVPIRSVLDREGVSPLVDAVVLSYEVGCVKPDHRIFRAALSALGLEAPSVLMVGDNANDDGGGASLGLRTLILPRTSGRVHGLDTVVRLVVTD